MPLMLDPGMARRRLGFADYLELPQDGLVHEIIDGRLFVTPKPSKRHQTTTRNLILHLESFAERAEIPGRILKPPAAVKLTEHEILQPDLFFVAAGRLDLLDGQILEGAPDLVVEVLADTKIRARDLVLKYRLYERYGVREYWIADPITRAVGIHRLLGGTLRKDSEESFYAGGVLASPLLPGLAIPVTEVFPRRRSRGTL